MERVAMIWVKAVGSVSGAALLIQALPVPDAFGSLAAFAGKLTVDVALLAGLWWMARRYDDAIAAKDRIIAEKDAARDIAVGKKDDLLARKDEHMLALVAEAGKTMALVIAGDTEVRSAIISLKDAMERWRADLDSARDIRDREDHRSMRTEDRVRSKA